MSVFVYAKGVQGTERHKRTLTMVTFSQMVYAMTPDETKSFILGYLREPYSFYSVQHRWMYDTTVKIRKTEFKDMVNEMATKVQKATGNTAEKATWGGFKNVTLTTAQLEQFDRDVQGKKYAWDKCMDHLLTLGKFSINYSNDSFSATITVVHKNQSWAMSAFSDSFLEAIQLLVCKTVQQPDWYTVENVEKKGRG